MKLAWIVVASAMPLVGGCLVHGHHPHGSAPPPQKTVVVEQHPSPPPRVVVIEKGHVHNEHCGHYMHGDRWYHQERHVHGRGCGHHWDGHAWVVSR